MCGRTRCVSEPAADRNRERAVMHLWLWLPKPSSSRYSLTALTVLFCCFVPITVTEQSVLSLHAMLRISILPE